MIMLLLQSNLMVVSDQNSNQILTATDLAIHLNLTLTIKKLDLNEMTPMIQLTDNKTHNKKYLIKARKQELRGTQAFRREDPSLRAIW